MRLKLLQAIRTYFPDTRIYLVEDRLVLVRGAMYTAFTPAEGFWEQPYSEALAREMCVTLGSLHNYEVDVTFMEPEPEIDEGSKPL